MNPTPRICGGWRWQERRAICPWNIFLSPQLPAQQLTPWFVEKNDSLPHLTESRKLLFLFRYQEHAHFSYQPVSLVRFYALL